MTLPYCPLLQPHPPHPTPSKSSNSFSFHVSVPGLPNPKPILYFNLEKTKKPAWVIRCFCFCFSFFVRMKRVKMVISQMGLSFKKKKNEMWNGGNKTSLFIYLELLYLLDYQMTLSFKEITVLPS